MAVRRLACICLSAPGTRVRSLSYHSILRPAPPECLGTFPQGGGLVDYPVLVRPTVLEIP